MRFVALLVFAAGCASAARSDRNIAPLETRSHLEQLQDELRQREREMAVLGVGDLVEPCTPEGLVAGRHVSMAPEEKHSAQHWVRISRGELFRLLRATLDDPGVEVRGDWVVLSSPRHRAAAERLLSPPERESLHRTRLSPRTLEHTLRAAVGAELEVRDTRLVVLRRPKPVKRALDELRAARGTSPCGAPDCPF